MELTFLVVSDPPHREIDLARAAELLGLTPAEVRMKANFTAPEIWLATAEEEQADTAAASLTEAGLDVVVLDARSIAAVPAAHAVTSFEFGDATFVARFRDGESAVAYDAPMLGVYCRPPAEERSTPSRKYYGHERAVIESVVGPDRSWATNTLEPASMLDLYVREGRQVSRISIGQNPVEFSGLGSAMGLSGGANLRTCVSECGNRFHRFVLDNRLENVRPRQHSDIGTARANERRLFSFGTLRLRKLLGSISPELGELTQFELGSRLAYLLHQSKDMAA